LTSLAYHPAVTETGLRILIGFGACAGVAALCGLIAYVYLTCRRRR